nr:DEAD-box ATP-dependent RNA helicase 21 [Tanacetum cinerariifolium]
MKRSIDYVSNTILHANKKPALRSSLTPHERRHARRDRIRKEETTPREQQNKLRKKDWTINQKHAKKREGEVEVESVKEVQVESKLNNKLLKATPSPIQMAAIPIGSQQRDVIGVAETSSGLVGNLYALLEIGAIAYYAVIVLLPRFVLRAD